MTSDSVTLWLVTGFAAALLDYSFAAGFGLVASLVLCGVLGYDPRSVAGAAALAQVVSALPVLAMHHRLGNISAKTIEAMRVLALFASASLIAALGLSTIAAKLPSSVVVSSYSVLLLALATMLYMGIHSYGEDPQPTSTGWVAAFYGALAGAYKALIGGGYSAVVVLAQRRLGLDLRSAIAVTPLVKLPAFVLVALVYTLSGHLDLLAALMLTLGALVATPLAAHLLRRTQAVLAQKALTATMVIVALIKIAQVLAGP